MGTELVLMALLNSLVDLLLLAGTNRLAGCPCRWGRLLAGAVLGGVYGCVCLVRPVRFLGAQGYRLAVLGLAAVVSFGLGRSGIKRGCLFVLLKLALEGLTQCLDRQGFWPLLVGVSGLWLLFCGAFSGECQLGESVEVKLNHDGKALTVTALRDTGNTLRDPVSGEPVLILGADAARELTGLDRNQLRHPLETMAAGTIPGLRLIPYRTVGQSCGMLLGIRVRDCVTGGKRGSAVVAFAPEGLEEGSRYQALTGGVL